MHFAKFRQTKSAQQLLVLVVNIYFIFNKVSKNINYVFIGFEE